MQYAYPTSVIDTSFQDQREAVQQIIQASRLIKEHKDNPRSSMTESDNSWLIPHESTFSSVFNWYQKYYYNYFDEALINSQANALAMRRDGFMHELYRHRQLPTVALEHDFDCDDPEDPGQVKIMKEHAKVINNIPYFQQLKLQLSESLHYGKSGAQFLWGRKRVSGRTYNTIVNHLPVNGDKITYKYDGTPGVLIFSGDSSIMNDPRKRQYVSSTDKGPAFFLYDEEFRDCFIIHEFERSDSDYLFESDKAMAVHGVGMRDRYYWLWNMRAELIGWMFDALQRVGANGMLYAYFQSGNPEARDQTLAALKHLIKENVAAFPTLAGQASSAIEHIETTGVGYEVLFNLIVHFEEIMRRGILGQNLSSQSAATGLGSGVADLQAGTFENIILYDASCLSETIDQQLSCKILKNNTWTYNGIRYRGEDLPFNIKFKLKVNRKNVSELIAAAQALSQMGVPLDVENLRDLAGLKAPKSSGTTTVQMPPQQNGQVPPKGNGQANAHALNLNRQSSDPNKNVEKFENCGIGPNGFERGNTCATKKGGYKDVSFAPNPFNPVQSDESFQERLDALGLNVTKDELLDLSGVHEDSKVTISSYNYSKDLVIRATGPNSSYHLERSFSKDDKGNLYISNDGFFVDEKYQGKGIGVEVLGKQIENARKHGFSYMITDAERSDDMIGYKVWPLFGYDGKLTFEQRLELPSSLKGAKKISDLYRTKEGREWWEENGDSVDLRFDLSDGSLSMKVWEAYKEAKRAKNQTHRPETSNYSKASGTISQTNDPGVLVSLKIPNDVARSLRIPDGEASADLHITLVYLGRISEVGYDVADMAREVVSMLSSYFYPLEGHVGGFGRFSGIESSDNLDVIYAGVNVPGLSELRDEICHVLKLAKVPYKNNNGYTPHVTLKYIEPNKKSPVDRIINYPVHFDSIRFSIGDESWDFPFAEYDEDLEYHHITENFQRHPCGAGEEGFEDHNTCATSHGGSHNPGSKGNISLLERQAMEKGSKNGSESSSKTLPRFTAPPERKTQTENQKDSEPSKPSTSENSPSSSTETLDPVQAEAKAKRLQRIGVLANVAKVNGFHVLREGRAFLDSAFKENSNKAGTIASFFPSKNAIIFNEDNPYYDDPKGAAKKLGERGWISTTAPEHVIVHEMGHGIHYKRVGKERYKQLRNQPIPDDIKELVIKEVSQYAATNNLEIVAEMFAAIQLADKKFSPKLMDYYNSIRK